MKKITVILLSLTILAIFFVSGCLNIKETKTEPAEEQGVINYEQQENNDLDELSNDISNIENLDNDLDNEDLANLEQDLKDIEW